eukprot:gene21327-28258_t
MCSSDPGFAEVCNCDPNRDPDEPASSADNPVTKSEMMPASSADTQAPKS